jgi:hypothetical protein
MTAADRFLLTERLNGLLTKLEARAHILETENRSLVQAHNAAMSVLGQLERDAAIQRDLTRALALRVEGLEKGLLLPGFDCHACGLFNGTLKEDLQACRGCATPRKGLETP